MTNKNGRSRPALTDDELFAAWMLYQEHLGRGGTMASAAAELGISASALQQRTALYREKAGIYVQKRTPRVVREDVLKQELHRIEKALQGELDRYFGIVLARLSAIEEQQKKQVIVKEFTPSHRRVVDGGLPINQQRKAFKRKMVS